MRIRMDRGLRTFLPGMAVMGMVALMRLGAEGELLWQAVRPRLAAGLTVMGAILLHECGHLAAAWGIGAEVREIRLDLLGARLELKGFLSYGQELFVAAAGPFVSLLGGAWAYPLWAVRGREGAGLFVCASAVLGAVNLLPIGTLDGGRILACGVSWLWGEKAAHRVLQITTGLFAALVWAVAAYALLRAGEMLSLFVFALCLLLREGGERRGGVKPG